MPLPQQPGEPLCISATRGRAHPLKAKATTAVVAAPTRLAEDAELGCSHFGKIRLGTQPHPGFGFRVHMTQASDSAPRPPPLPRPVLWPSGDHSRAPSWSACITACWSSDLGGWKGSKGPKGISLEVQRGAGGAQWEYAQDVQGTGWISRTLGTTRQVPKTVGDFWGILNGTKPNLERGYQVVI